MKTITITDEIEQAVRECIRDACGRDSGEWYAVTIKPNGRIVQRCGTGVVTYGEDEGAESTIFVQHGISDLDPCGEYMVNDNGEYVDDAGETCEGEIADNLVDTLFREWRDAPTGGNAVEETNAVEDDRVLRHGDVAAIPVRMLPRGERQLVASTPAGTQVIDSHVLHAAELVEINGTLYALNPLLQHLKGQHPDVSGTGWHRIQVGLRAAHWQFARPTAD